MCEQNVFSIEVQGGLGPGVCCPKTIVQATSKLEALAFVLQLLRLCFFPGLASENCHLSNIGANTCKMNTQQTI